MNKLKFRAWDFRNQIMVQDALVLSETQQLVTVNAEHFNSPFSFFDGCKWMQFIGKLDVDGKEIYNGDILYSTYWNRGNNKKGSPYHVVKWNNIQSRWIAEGWNGFSKVGPGLDVVSDFKIVGNIYQNEDLLEIKKR